MNSKVHSEIATFVEEVLTGISDGYRAAQEYARSNDGIPLGAGNLNGESVPPSSREVEFELSIMVSSEKTVSGSGKADGFAIRLVAGEISADGQYSSNAQAAHTVKFAVPNYPSMNYKNEGGE